MLEYLVYFLCAVAAYLAFKYFFGERQPPQAYEEEEIEFPPTEKKDMTLEELRKYDGTSEAVLKRIYIAVGGKIHDVTTRPHFYGPEGGYHVFAGRDATYALATGSLEPNDMDKWPLPRLSPMEQSTLADWEMTTFWKYPVVGKLLGRQPGDMPKEEGVSDKKGEETKDSEEKTQQREYTLEDVWKHNGGNVDKILVVVKGLVFDVSNNEHFKKGGKYSLFSGRDASLCLAKDLHTDEYLDKSISDCSYAEIQRLESHLQDFHKSEKVIGHLKKGAGATADQAEFYLPAPDPTPEKLHEAILKNDNDELRSLLQSGKHDIESRSDRTDLTALQYAIQEKNLLASKTLVEHGASISAKSVLYDKKDVLELAKHFKFHDFVEYLEARDSRNDENSGVGEMSENIEVSEKEDVPNQETESKALSRESLEKKKDLQHTEKNEETDSTSLQSSDLDEAKTSDKLPESTASKAEKDDESNAGAENVPKESEPKVELPALSAVPKRKRKKKPQRAD